MINEDTPQAAVGAKLGVESNPVAVGEEPAKNDYE